MSAIDVAQKEIIPVIDHLSDVSKWVHGAIIAAKDFESDLRECEDCDYDPDLRLKDRLEVVINTSYYLSRDLQRCEEHLSEIVRECGWDIDYDEHRDEYHIVSVIEDGEK